MSDANLRYFWWTRFKISMIVAIRSDNGNRLKLTPTPSRNPSTSSICGGGGSAGTGSSLNIASTIRLRMTMDSSAPLSLAECLLILDWIPDFFETQLQRYIIHIYNLNVDIIEEICKDWVELVTFLITMFVNTFVQMYDRRT